MAQTQDDYDHQEEEIDFTDLEEQYVQLRTRSLPRRLARKRHCC
jgi:hypothetical protein